MENENESEKSSFENISNICVRRTLDVVQSDLQKALLQKTKKNEKLLEHNTSH